MEYVKITVDDKEEIFEGKTLQEAKEKRSLRLKELREDFKKRHANDTEEPAEGRRGFFLYNPFDKKHFFRIYDPEDKRKFTDYAVCAEDIEVEILAGGLSLYKNEEGDNRLDWSSEVMGREPKPLPEKKTIGFVRYTNMVMCEDECELPISFKVKDESEGPTSLNVITVRCYKDIRDPDGLVWTDKNIVRYKGRDWKLNHQPAYSVILKDYVFMLRLDS